MVFFLKRYGFYTAWLHNPKQEDINEYMKTIHREAEKITKENNGKRIALFVFYAGIGKVIGEHN